ncbi:type I secretion system ATPase [Pseudomonas sp. BAY1663]|nr:type I secretion system ATPase [Pseudomonas sp. BAY1663]
MPNQRLSATLLPRAAARAGLQGRVIKRTLAAISPLNLPVLLLLKNGRSAVLARWGDDNRALILPSEAEGGEQWVAGDVLAEDYSGEAFFARPRHELEETRNPLLPRVHAWFRDTLKLSRWLYADAMVATLLVNTLGLMVPLFVMQTYDRVVPNQATATLWYWPSACSSARPSSCCCAYCAHICWIRPARRPTWCSRPRCSNASPA